MNKMQIFLEAQREHIIGLSGRKLSTDVSLAQTTGFFTFKFLARDFAHVLKILRATT